MAFRLIPGLGRQFTFVDAGTGTISSSHFNRCYEIAKTASDEMRSRIDEIDRNADEYNHYWTVCEVLDDFEHWKVLQQFDNWAIGCELADLPVDAAELMSLDFRFAKVNRTEVVSDLTDEIIRAFDDGLIRSKHILWKDGFPYEKREAFRAAWSAASIQRPNLSKHGPKTLK